MKFKIGDILIHKHDRFKVRVINIGGAGYALQLESSFGIYSKGHRFTSGTIKAHDNYINTKVKQSHYPAWW